METDLEHLAERLKSGDNNAACELVDLYYRQIYLFMRRLGHNDSVSEDLTQRCFIYAWQHIARLQDAGALITWLYHIATSESRQYLRWYRFRKTLSADWLRNCQADDPGSVRKNQDDEQLKRLTRAISKLPIKIRQAVVLHYLQHLSIPQTAEAMGVPEGTVKSRLNRALINLRRWLGGENGEML